MSFAAPQHTRQNTRLLVYSLFCFVVTSLLLFTGAMTTTIGAGMVFLDWPLSNGSINPPGWMTDPDMLAEHSHRLTGMVIGLLTLGLCVWTWCVEPRRWVKYLALGALLLVLLQALLGGLRVLFVSTDLALVHGCVAQIFLGTLATCCLAQTRFVVQINRRPTPVPARALTWTQVLVGLVVAQLLIAATMRHMGAGLAIPTFPLMPDGGLLPQSWPTAVSLHFAHRAMALVIVIATVLWARQLFPNLRSPFIRGLGWAFVGLLLIQVLLGALTIWTQRNPWVATAHVLIGAYLLAVCWSCCFATWLERRRYLAARILEAEPANVGDTPQTATMSAEPEIFAR